TFTRGTQSADLNWRGGSLAMWQRDRAHDASLVVHRTVLGHPAQISRYPRSDDYTAIWPDGGRVLELRTQIADLAAFEQLLASLKRVDVDAWLSALPASTIRAAGRPSAVDEML